MARTRNQDRAGSAEPSKRNGRKRRASTESEVSVQVEETATGSQQPQIKRRRKQEQRTDSRDESQTLEDVIELSEAPDVTTLREESIAVVHPLKHVHFTETAADEKNVITATQITPHPRKTTIHRRVTLSPSEFREPRPTHKGKARASLPPAFSASQGSPATSTQEFHFAPLSQVLEERTRRRLRRNRLSEEGNNIERVMKEDAQARKELHRLRAEIQQRDSRVQELEYELEMQRQFSIDVDQLTVADRQRTKAMEDELADLRQEIEEKQSQEASWSQLDGADDVDVVGGADYEDDDDMLVYNSQEQSVSYPELPSASRRITETTTTTVMTEERDGSPGDRFEGEREAFEQAIKHWTREASVAASPKPND